MKGIIMPENQKPALYVVTNVIDLVEVQKKQARIARRKLRVKSFVIGAAIGFTIVTAIRMVAEAVSYDDNQEEKED
jgi:hypothetical protein